MKNKNCKIYISVFAVLCGFVANSQTANISSGGNFSGSGGTINFSIGQISYTNENGSGGMINQGVQQPFEIYLLGINNYPSILLTITAYPNPTTSLVNLSITEYAIENLDYKLLDLNGRLLFSKKIETADTQIQFENYPSGTYLLEITNDYKTIKTFKIIKK